MVEFPGFPCNDFDFHFEEAGSALAGLIIRDRYGYPVPGVLPSTETLLTAGTGWEIRVAPFVAVRAKGRAVLLGGTSQELQLEVAPAPSANARLDVIYSLPAEVGSGDPVEAARVVTGTPGAVPVKPSIPEGAIELGTYRSQAGQSSAAQGQITNTFPLTATAGGVLVARTKTVLDGISLMDGARGYVLADRRTYVRRDGSWVDPGARELWSGTPIFLNGSQEVTLPESIQEQPTGIILVWQEYRDGAPLNASWNYTHIPKAHPSGPGIACPLTHFDGSSIRKYVYVNGAKLTGHANNQAAPANKLVLSRVLSY